MHELPMGTVTLLFTDMEGSTRLLQLLGKRYADVLAECRDLMRAAFQQHHGHEVDTQGDAFFVAFARASDAISAVVTAQRALAGHSWPEGVPVRVRMGLHTGEPDLASEGYVGLSVHHAARIMSAGHGGQVLLSQVTCDLVEHDLPEKVSLRDLGAHRLKDLRHPHRLFQLVIAGLAADFPALKTLDSSPNNLPIQPTAFIGREKEVAAVQRHLLREGVRLLTLTGPGGVGKTRLGLQVAAEVTERFTDGTWFVSLAAVSDPELVLPSIAQTLGLQEEGDRSLLYQLQITLREKQVLLLLDNFEQVASAARHVADLLTVCSRLKVLVTSREALHVRAEREFPVPALALPDLGHLPDLETLSQYEAVALFIERAQAVKPAFQVTNATAPAVAEICARLDGLPLAIELAAACIKLFPPQDLLHRLTQRLPLLTSSLRDVPARQQTLRKTIQWSYDLLAPQEQHLFRRLSVFSGGCTLQAIEAVTAALGDETTLVLEEVASLIDKNLLQQTASEGEELRLTMLETIREYGREALTTSGEMQGVRQAHAAYYFALAEEAAPRLKGPQQAEWLDRLEREHDNLRATLTWSLEPAQAGPGIEMALRLCEALVMFWDVRGLYSEGRSFLEQAIADSEGVATPMRARALRAAAGFADNQSDSEAEPLFQESLALYRRLGDTRGIASSLQGLGSLAQLNNLAKACSLFEESLVLYREVGDKEAIAWVLGLLADAVSTQGDYRRGQALFKESVGMFRKLGNKQGTAMCLTHSATSTASRKFRRSLGTSGRPFVGPVKSSVGRAIVVSNKGQDAGAQLLHGDATESGKQATNQDREPDLNLVEPGTVSGSIHEANAVSGIGEKGCARAHAGEMATFAFDAQVFLYITLRSDQTHQRFRLMGVQLISDKDPGGIRIGLDSLGDVSGKVGFGARGSDAGSDDLSRGHIQISDQTLGAVSVVFKFLSLDVTGLHGQRRVETFEGLDAGHLIGTGYMGTRRGKRGGGLIHLTHRADLLSQFERIVGGWGEPIPLTMGL